MARAKPSKSPAATISSMSDTPSFDLNRLKAPFFGRLNAIVPGSPNPLRVPRKTCFREELCLRGVSVETQSKDGCLERVAGAVGLEGYLGALIADQFCISVEFHSPAASVVHVDGRIHERDVDLIEV